MSGAPRPIAVQTLVSESTIYRFDRWFSAAIDALVGAREVGALGRWRLLVGVDSAVGPFDPAFVAECEERAIIAGGTLAYVAIGDTSGWVGGHNRLLAEGDDDLVLLLDIGAIVLASTIVRLVESLDDTAVGARQVPLDVACEREVSDANAAESNPGCILFSRAALTRQDGADLARFVSVELADNTSVAGGVSYRPQAVVFRDSTNFEPIEHVDALNEINARVVGSLLEEAIGLMGLEGARAAVAKTLTQPGGPLLSVVMRTQVLRHEPLRDALVCLAGQTDGRFELLLVVHDGDVTAARSILSDQPEWLRSRAQVLSASGGTRSHPLNIGIGAATGQLVAFLDDDDVVFAHWVQSFLEAYERNPRRLLRAAVGVQEVTTTTWPGGISGHETVSPMTVPYPPVFDLADHLRVNRTPFMACAFPRGFFAAFGAADESLEVCEDWDLVLRAASTLGVVDLRVVTAIYRRWNSGSDSYSLHDSETWNRDMQRVREKLDGGPLLMAAGSATELANLSSARSAREERDAMLRSSSWHLTAPLRALSRRLSRINRRLGGALGRR